MSKNHHRTDSKFHLTALNNPAFRSSPCCVPKVQLFPTLTTYGNPTSAMSKNMTCVLHRWLFSSFTLLTTEGPSLAPAGTFLSLHPTLTVHGEAPLGLVTPPCILVLTFLPLPGPLFQTLPIVFSKRSLHALDTFFPCSSLSPSSPDCGEFVGCRAEVNTEDLPVH